MTGPTRYGAVVLAAGFSSRMGTSKPLLEMGPRSVLERVATNLSAAGITDIVVVTGHEQRSVSAEVERLGLREAHNPGYAEGMFTSVQSGARALPPGLQAFFVLPVDYPLVGPSVFGALVEAHGERGADVLYPTCRGRRGHPPLLSMSLAASLASADPSSNLRVFLEGNADNSRDVEVEDLSILLDMDTPQDFAHLKTLAQSIDCVEPGGCEREPVISAETAMHLLTVLRVEQRVIRHATAVASVAVALAEELNEAGGDLDIDMIRAAGLLHDMAKGSRRHAAEAQTLLAGLGLSTLGEIVGAHMVLPAHEAADSPPRERELVYVADKLVVEDCPGDLSTRADYALATYGRDETSRAAIKDRLQRAADIIALVERSTGRTVDDIMRSRGLVPEE